LDFPKETHPKALVMDPKLCEKTGVKKVRPSPPSPPRALYVGEKEDPLLATEQTELCQSERIKEHDI